MPAAPQKLLLRVIAGMLLVLIVLAIANATFSFDWFGRYDRIVLIDLGGLIIALVLFVPLERETPPQPTARRQTTRRVEMRRRLHANDLLALLGAVGILFFGAVPQFMRGDSPSLASWLILGLAAAIVAWVARRPK
jgi:hypothetical protein